MRKTLIMSSVAMLGLMTVPALPMPFPSMSEAPSDTTLVAWGCGPGWTRGPWGHCHPMGYGYRPAYGYGVVAPVYGPRRCWRGPFGGLHCRWW
jgi:hypothetical protein